MQGIFNVGEGGGVPFRSIHFTGQSLRNSLFAALYEGLQKQDIKWASFSLFAALYEGLQKTGHQMGLLLLICCIIRGGTKNRTSNGPVTPHLLRYTRGYKKQDIKWACYSSFAALYEGVQKTGHQMGLLLLICCVIRGGTKNRTSNGPLTSVPRYCFSGNERIFEQPPTKP